MLYNLACIAVSLGQVLSACGYGLALLAALGLAPIARPPYRCAVRLLLALGAGLVAQSTLISLSALAMLLNRPIILAILVCGWFLLVWALPRAGLRGFLSLVRERMSLSTWTRTGLALGLVCSISVVTLFLESLVPDFSGDAYLYHISAPLFYVLEGGFVTQPWAVYYHYPLLTEMLYAPALAFHLEQAAILLNFWITLAAACAIVGLGTAIADRGIGVLAAALYLLAPLVLQWSPTAQPETGATLLLLLSAHALVLWRKSGRVSYAFLAGLLGGGLVGCKILYALFVIALYAVLCMTVLRDAWRGRGRHVRAGWWSVGAYALAAAVAYGVWIAKSFVFTRDPLFPMAVGLFATVPSLKNGALFFANMHGFPAWAGSYAWITAALRGAFRLIESSDVAFFLGMLGVPIMCARAAYLREQRFLWLSIGGVFLVVCHYGGILQTRWFIPAYALFTLPAALTIRWTIQCSPSPALRKGVVAALLVLVPGNYVLGYRERLYGTDSRGVGIHGPFVGLTTRSRAEFLAELPCWATARRVNRAVPVAGRALVLQDPPYPQVRWYERRFVQNGQYWLGDLFRQGLSTDRVAAQLRKGGITHIVAAEGTLDPRLLDFLAREAKLVDAKGSFHVYAMRE